MDANGNGMLEPDEMQGRARMMLERMAGDAELDLSRPIPLATIERAFNDMRERRAGEGGDPRFRGGGGEEGGGRGGSRQAEPEPLVAGFGEVDLFDPVPGFGAEGERYAVKIDAEDREEALRTLTRYDNNKDGLLDGDEIRNARWSDDPLSTDRNRDGKLTLTELALRYAMRRAQRDGESGDNAQASGNRSGNNRSARSGGQSAPRGNSSEDENRNRWAEMLFGRFDRDGNNVLEGDELSEFRGSERFDANQDGKITRDEIGQAMSNMRGRGGGGPGGEQGGRSNFFARREDGGERQEGDGGGAAPSASGRKSYRRTTAADRLADLEGLPEWFARSDADQDGQIRMAEYGSSWSDELVADFMQFDLNGDGIITPQECLDASEKGAVQGVTSGAGSSSRGGGFGSRGRERSAERRPDTAAGAEAAASSAAASTAPAAAGNVSDRYVKFAVGVIKKYDKNGDGVLTEDEWKSMPDDRSQADTDQDGRLTPVELATAYSQDN
jgi:Ca2+-binding EF-hand superfamily protein